MDDANRTPAYVPILVLLPYHLMEQGMESFPSFLGGIVQVGFHLPDAPIDQPPVALRALLLPHLLLDLPGQEQGERPGGSGVLAQPLENREPCDGEVLASPEGLGDLVEPLDLLA